MPYPYIADGRAIERSMLLTGSADALAALIQDPGSLPRWLCDRAEVRPFGAQLVWDQAEGSQAIDIFRDAPRQGETCAYRWESEFAGHDTRFAFSLADEDGACRLVFREDGFGDGPAWDAAIAEQAAGWAEVLGKLERIGGRAPGRTIEVSGLLPAPPEDVYRALVTADALSGWFAATDGQAGVRQGGAYHFGSVDAPTAGQGRVLANRPLRALALSWQGSRELLPPTEVDFTLDPRPEGAWLEIRHAGWGTGKRWDEAFAETEAGWREVLADLQQYFVGAARSPLV